MESLKHHNLVKKMNEYIVNYENAEVSLVESDIFEVNGKVTRMPEGFVPDLYYKYNGLLIIGEAKTDSDFEREHSLQQYISYLKYLKKYSDEYRCIFIIAVPWETTKTACRIINKLAIENDKLEIIFINEMGVYKKYEKNKNSE